MDEPQAHIVETDDECDQSVDAYCRDQCHRRDGKYLYGLSEAGDATQRDDDDFNRQNEVRRNRRFNLVFFKF